MKNEQDYWEKQPSIDLSSHLTQNLVEKIFEPFPQTLRSELPQQSSANDIFQSLEINCSCGNPVYLYCSSINCRSHTGICSEKNANCSQKHSDCLNLINSKNLHKLLNSKIIRDKATVSPIINEAEKTMDKIIDQISQMKAQLEQKMKHFGMNNTESKITEIILEQEKQTKETQVRKIFQNDNKKKISFIGNSFNDYLKQEGKEIDWVYESIARFNKIIDETNKKVNHYFKNIRNLFEELHMKFTEKYPYANYFKGNTIFRELQNLNTGNNQATNLVSILDKQLKYKSIRKIFQYRKLLNSSQNFNFKQFHEQVEGKSNLLFTIKNQYNKVFGFFTGSKLVSNAPELTIKQENRSFLFSTNCKISEALIEPNYSLNYDKKAGIIEIGKFEFDLGQQSLLNNNKNGAKLYFGNSETQNIYPSAELFLKRCQQGQTSTQYFTIHGENRKNEPNFKGFQIYVLEIYAIDVVEFKIESLLTHQPTSQQNNTPWTQTLYAQPRMTFTNTNMFGNNQNSGVNKKKR